MLPKLLQTAWEFIERKGYTPGGNTGDSGKSDMESFGSQVPFDEEIPF